MEMTVAAAGAAGAQNTMSSVAVALAGVFAILINKIYKIMEIFEVINISMIVQILFTEIAKTPAKAVATLTMSKACFFFSFFFNLTNIHFYPF